MAEIHEHDAMGCRACGREERASEGYPCANCGTFICLICTFRGVTLCRECAAKEADGRRDRRHRPRRHRAGLRRADAPVRAGEPAGPRRDGRPCSRTRGDWRRVRIELDGYGAGSTPGYCVEVDERRPTPGAQRGRPAGASARSCGSTGAGVAAAAPRPRGARAATACACPTAAAGALAEGARHPGGGGDRRPPAPTAPERWALEHFAGAPYEWGGVTPCGVDCSGLVQTTFLARGVTLPRDSRQQASCGAPVSPDVVRPGDLLFFRGEASARSPTSPSRARRTRWSTRRSPCGGMVQEPWLPGSRAAPLRERLVAVRRLEER